MINSKVPNRLASEKSPYLLQHAYNPVDWYPWATEAFEKAKVEDKPVFLSIGYSTCHWCHVMEKESFEDKETARILNDNFVSVKVDRELRPDIDIIYMKVCQALTGSGGWPLSVFMTPDKKPFYAGTYFPKESQGRYPGFIDLLHNISDMWKNDRTRLITGADKAELFLKKETSIKSENIDPQIINNVYEQIKSYFEPKYGGFGYAPKFPTPHYIFFLLRYYKMTNDQNALSMVEHTLQSIYKGGIFDHVGFGFSRYSTDNKWLVPHFEKMLYDNALLSIAYSECFALTGNELYKEIAEKVFRYILRDMTSPEGAFYSAEDADSEGIEGKYYVWSYKELSKILNDNRLKTLSNIYDVSPAGNFEGFNILNLINTDLSKINETGLKRELEDIISSLYDHRQKRVRPFKDTKILTSWNGMMIAALAIGGRILSRSDYIVSAKNAVKFILKAMTDEDGRLLNGYKHGVNSAKGYLDDYVYFIWGLNELYRSTSDPEYLKKSLELNDITYKLFWDDQNAGYYFYGTDNEELLVRAKEHYDGAVPAGNAVAAMNLLTFYEYTEEYKLKEQADKLFKAFGSIIKEQPVSHIHFLNAFIMTYYGTRQIVLTGRDKTELQRTRQRIDKKFLPFTTCMLYDGSDESTDVIPRLKNYLVNDKITAYVCENFNCRQPTQDINQVVTNLY